MAEHALQRGLANRHIQLIALGGAIGTGLFLGSAGVLKLAGPSMLLGYAIAGLVAFLIMRQLGEMVVQEPVAGSFSYFAHRYWSGYAGFLAGWNYWALYVLVGMAELTAVGKYVQFWWPDMPNWLTVALCFVLINTLNLTSVKAFGETEFWFALIKIVAIVGMILFGLYLLLGQADPQARVANLWSRGGFFPQGVMGLVMALAFIMFSFGGLELVGITAAEAKQPEQVIPKAINQVVYRILIFYIGALGILLMLHPWDVLLTQLTQGNDAYRSSPFVQIFALIGQDTAAHVLNLVVLTAALSVYNSAVYCNSRMLYGLARQNDAPRWLAYTDRRGVPVAAIGLSAAVTALCVLVNYLLPQEALQLLMSLVVATLVINWAMISLAHLRFRRAMDAQGITPRFKALAYPLANYGCLAFMGLVLWVLWSTPDVRLSVWIMPFWLILIYGCYRARGRASKQSADGAS